MSNSSVWPIDKTLSDATTPDQSGHGSDGNEGVFHLPQNSKTWASSSHSWVSYVTHWLQKSYPSNKMQSVQYTAPVLQYNRFHTPVIRRHDQFNEEIWCHVFSWCKRGHISRLYVQFFISDFFLIYVNCMLSKMYDVLQPQIPLHTYVVRVKKIKNNDDNTFVFLFALFLSSLFKLKPEPGECSRGVMVKVAGCGIIVSEFILLSRYYVNFRANTLRKGMNALILPAMG